MSRYFTGRGASPSDDAASRHPAKSGDRYRQPPGRARRVAAEERDAEERLVALNDTLARTRITAPVAGTVVDLQVHTLGAVVRGGDPLLDLVPAGDGFVIEARVPNHDVDHLYPGQSAEIRFSAFNQRLSNVIDGEASFAA